MRRALLLLVLAGCFDGTLTDDDAGTTVDAGAGGADGLVEGPARYPADRTLSPITPSVAAHLRAIGTGGQPDVFAKVGASATASESFLHCFAGTRVDLAGRVELQPALDFFRGGDAAGTTPFDRTSLSAVVGMSAGWAISGDPSPLESELAAIDPRLAVVMYGTNDIQLRNLPAYADNLLTLTDELIAAGVVPALTTIMPRDDDPEADALVPRYNAVVRAVAQARQVPLIDFHRELLPLPDHGLGPDDIHPSVYREDGLARPCVFTADGLRYGYNLRNLITLQTLARMRDALDGRPAPDPAQPPASGAIDALPWVGSGNTAASTSRDLDHYRGSCNAPQDESGPEVVYRLEVARTTAIHAGVFDRGSVDVDLHLLRGAATEDACVARAHQELTATLTAGTWYLVVDTFVSQTGGERAGEYLVTVIEE